MIWRHALRNAAVPLVTVIALSYAALLEGSVLTETVFAWPGIGLYITNSLQNADMNAVLGGTIVDRRCLRRAQPVVRRALPSARSEDALRWQMRAFAYSPGCGPGCSRESPHSRWQARLGRFYVGWRRFLAQSARGRRASVIVLAADPVAIFADCSRPIRPSSAVICAPAPAAAERRPTGSAPTTRRATSFRASSTARGSRSGRRARLHHRRADRPRWSAPSPAISAAGSTRC